MTTVTLTYTVPLAPRIPSTTWQTRIGAIDPNQGELLRLSLVPSGPPVTTPVAGGIDVTYTLVPDPLDPLAFDAQFPSLETKKAATRKLWTNTLATRLRCPIGSAEPVIT